MPVEKVQMWCEQCKRTVPAERHIDRQFRSASGFGLFGIFSGTVKFDEKIGNWTCPFCGSTRLTLSKTAQRWCSDCGEYVIAEWHKPPGFFAVARWHCAKCRSTNLSKWKWLASPGTPKPTVTVIPPPTNEQEGDVNAVIPAAASERARPKASPGEEIATAVAALLALAALLGVCCCGANCLPSSFGDSRPPVESIESKDQKSGIAKY